MKPFLKKGILYFLKLKRKILKLNPLKKFRLLKLLIIKF